MQIVYAVLASSVVAAFITWVTNSWLSNQNYKQEYHRQLVSKRLRAYGAVESVLQILAGHAVYHDRLIPRAFNSRSQYLEFLTSVILALTQSVWLTHDITRILENINSILTRASTEFKLDIQIDAPDSIDHLFQDAGLKYDNELTEQRAELFKRLRSDYLRLHKIEGFDKI